MIPQRYNDPDGLRHHARQLERREDQENLQALINAHPWLGRELALKWFDLGEPVWAEEDGEVRPLLRQEDPRMMWESTPKALVFYLPCECSLLVRGLHMKPLVSAARMRLFACDCAGPLLDVYERAVPGDSRPRHAAEVTRRYALAEATREEMDRAFGKMSAATYEAAHKHLWNGAWKAVWSLTRLADPQRIKTVAWILAENARAFGMDCKEQERLLMRRLVEEDLRP